MEDLELIVRISYSDLKSFLERIRQIVRQELERIPGSPPAANESPTVPATRQALAVSKAEAAKILGVSRRTIDYSIALKEINVLRVGRRVLVPMKSLEAIVRRGSFRTGAVSGRHGCA